MRQMATLPALAAPTLNEAIVEVSESSYPVLKALKAEEFTAFSEKLGGLILDSPSLKPDQLTKSIELGLDVFNSVPESNVKSFIDLEKKAFSGLGTDSCTLVPLPSARLPRPAADAPAPPAARPPLRVVTLAEAQPPRPLGARAHRARRRPI